MMIEKISRMRQIVHKNISIASRLAKFTAKRHMSLVSLQVERFIEMYVTSYCRQNTTKTKINKPTHSRVHTCTMPQGPSILAAGSHQRLVTNTRPNKQFDRSRLFCDGSEAVRQNMYGHRPQTKTTTSTTAHDQNMQY